MSKIVGLSRALTQDWLNKTVEFVLQGDDEATIKKKLNEYLSFEIGSPTNLRKTREILLNVWVKPVALAPETYSRAIQAYKSDRSNKLALSWAMILLAYPVFSDATGLIGKISNVQDTFTTSWLREKLHEEWGERSTLLHTCNKILQTLKYLGAIESLKTGTYRVRRYKISDEQTIIVLLMNLLVLERKAYYEIPELSRIPLFFPFEFSVPMEWLHNSPDFTLESFGGKTVLSAAK
jgi:hypothetical protein